MDINLSIKILKDTSRVRFSDNEQEALKTVIDELDKRRDIITNMAVYISGKDNDEDICKHADFDLDIEKDLDCESQGRECVSCLIEWFGGDTWK